MEEKELARQLKYCEPLITLVLERAGLGSADRNVGVLVAAAVTAGSLTGYDYCFDIAVEAYYDAKDSIGSMCLSEPRNKKVLDIIVEAVEASIAFEESLADDESLLLSEPILVAAASGLCPGDSRVLIEPSISSMVIVVESFNKPKRMRIEAPGVLAMLGLHALARAMNVELRPYTTGKALLVAPDPAYIRRRLFEEKPLLPELGKRAVKVFGETCSRAEEQQKRLANSRARLDEFCDIEDIVLVEYILEGAAYWKTRYPCLG